jgi:enamine deaminase RidA (YjgF/YER057c/UK114 family)
MAGDVLRDELVQFARTRASERRCGSKIVPFYTESLMIKHLPVLALALMVSATASAQARKDIPLPPSQNPSNADLPISGAVWAGNTLYVSGWLDPDLKTHTDTKSQTVGILADIQKLLASQKLTMGDVTMVHVFLGNNPATNGQPDFAGMMAGYTQFFGTRDQPSKPARTTVQVVLPAAARGALIEIDLIAVRPK